MWLTLRPDKPEVFNTGWDNPCGFESRRPHRSGKAIARCDLAYYISLRSIALAL